MTFLKLLAPLALAACGLCGAAQAAIVNGSDFTAGLSAQTIEGISFKAAGGRFESKAAGAYLGVGVSGQTGGEIDVLGESITGTFNGPGLIGPQVITGFILGLLFNGPEYGDLMERARVSLFDGARWHAGVLQVGRDDHQATWDFGGSRTIFALEDAVENRGGVWQVANPFGDLLAHGIRFDALDATGFCHRGACNNNSDYNLVQLTTAVPEPGSVALIVASLAAMVLSAARRRVRS